MGRSRGSIVSCRSHSARERCARSVRRRLVEVRMRCIPSDETADLKFRHPASSRPKQTPLSLLATNSTHPRREFNSPLRTWCRPPVQYPSRIFILQIFAWIILCVLLHPRLRLS